LTQSPNLKVTPSAAQSSYTGGPASNVGPWDAPYPGQVMLVKFTTPNASGAVITSVDVAGSPASAGIAQNAWLEIKGMNLVPGNTPAAGVIWSSAPEFSQGRMPTQIGTISVTVNGKPAYVYFYCSALTSTICTSDQVNVLSPFDSTLGSVQIVVSNGSTASAPYTATVKTAVPSFLLFSAPYVVATHADYSLLGPTSLYPGLSTPANPNETVLVYGVGSGLPTTPITPGSSSQFGSLPATPVCTVGGSNAAVSAALISPGLYQFNITVPTGVKSGDNTVNCTYNSVSTPAADVLAVQ